MNNQTYEEYSSSLNAIYQKNQSSEILRKVCPHLTDEQINQLISRSLSGEASCFAVPPLLVLGGCHILSLEGTSKKGGSTSVQISYACAHRTRESYADHKLHGDREYMTLYQTEAITYAKNWPNTLIIDDWDSIYSGSLKNPKLQNAHGQAKTVAFFGFTTTGEYSLYQSFRNYTNKQQRNLAKICQITSSGLMFNELRGGRGEHPGIGYCALCGGGLSGDSCTGCGAQFKDSGCGIGHSAPMPPELVEHFIAHGHRFEISPTIAQKKTRIEQVARGKRLALKKR